MSKFLKVTLVFAAFLAAFVMLPMMALQASSTVPSPAAPVPVAQPLTPNAVVSITILHTNDFHGQLEPTGSPLGSSNPGIARVGYIISDVIRPAVGTQNVVLLDAGDEMQGRLAVQSQAG